MTILYKYVYLLNGVNVEMCIKNTSRKTILRTRRNDENCVDLIVSYCYERIIKVVISSNIRMKHTQISFRLVPELAANDQR